MTRHRTPWGSTPAKAAPVMDSCEIVLHDHPCLQQTPDEGYPPKYR